MKTEITLSLPDWVGEIADASREYAGDEDKMHLAILLAKRNAASGTGGPFGAAVFEQRTGKLVSAGVNRVLPESCSVAHAEIMALALAQQRLGRPRLAHAEHSYVLAASAQPCAMCFGALPWAGIACLLCAARREDVERIAGFDEGPAYPGWTGELEQRGITVVRDVLRTESCAVLKEYARGDGPAY